MSLAFIWSIFVSNLLPILLCAGTGFVLGRTIRPDIKTASHLAFFIFSPCLVFVSLTHVAIPAAEFSRLALFTVAVTLVIGACAFLTGKVLRVERHLLVSLMVSSMFVNGGNYGLAATKFAFGEQALARAMVCFVSGTVAIYTLGVLLSSMGKLPVWDAFRQLLKVPAVYSILAALLVLRTNIRVPLFVDRSVTLLGDASIPLMLVILGLQIAQARIWPRGRLRLISSAAFLQLVMTPLVSLLVAHFMGMTGVSRQAAVLISSMPAAVVTTVLAVQYDLDGALVSGTVVITTLLSPITLAPLIAYLT